MTSAAARLTSPAGLRAIAATAGTLWLVLALVVSAAILGHMS